MRLRSVCSLLLLVALLASTLVSCGFASPLTKRSVVLSEYPVSAQAENVGISTNLGDIRVMSFNLQNTMSSDTTLKENRYLAVSDQIQDYMPTLLGLQEDGSHWNTYLSSVLVSNGSYKRINNTASTSEFCSIYYDSSVLGKPIASGANYLSHDGTKESKYSLTWDEIPADIKKELNMTESYYKSGKTGLIYNSDKNATEAVGVLTARLMTYGIFELNGQKFLYVNTHLTHRSQNSGPAVDYPEFLQLRELARIKEWDIIHSNVTKLLKQYGDMPVIITGDLNEVPGSASYNHYATHYDNAAKLAKLRKGPDGSWNAGFSKSENGKLFSSIKNTDNQASSTLDYCFISPNDFTVEQFQVAENSQYITNSEGKKGYVYVSDHLAIVTDLSFGVEKGPMALQKPGSEKEGSKISYYSGKPDTSWFDIKNPLPEYVLTTADQLMGFIYIRKNITKDTYFFEDVTIKLGANMVINQLKDGIRELAGPEDLKTDYIWSTLDSSYHFKGILDGQGHYISGVLFEAGGSGAKGLFGGIGGNAEIKNFSLVNTYMTTVYKNTGKNRMGSVAAIVASGSDVTFYNIESSAIIVPPSEDAQVFDQVGGILGQASSKDGIITFDHCTFSGEILVEGSSVGGIVGHVGHSSVSVRMSNCINAGKINANKYVGGLIGFAKAKSLYVNNCANIGDVTAGRCSGGLIGTISQCPDLIIADCAVSANLDFSSIGNGGTAENPVSVPAGCQVGGLIGRTYDVDGHVSGISLSGTMRGAANIVTSLDKGTNDVTSNYLASGAIVGFNSCYADDATVMQGEAEDRVFSHIHFDTILVSMEMTDVGSYLGGTRDTPINSKFSKISWRNVIYDQDKFEASVVSTLWGARIDRDRYINSSGEANDQIFTPWAASTAVLHTAEGLNAKINDSGKTINYTTSRAKFTTWQKVSGGVLVPTVALRDLIQSAVKTEDLFVQGYQTKANAENAALTDYRFVSVMKDTGVPAIGYHVTISYLNAAGEKVKNEQTVYCPNVYTKIKGGNEVYEASKLGGDYLFTLVIEGVPATGTTANDITVTVQPFGAEKNGAEILFTDYRAMTYVLN